MMLPFTVPQRWRRPLEIAGYGAAALLIAVLTLYSSLSRERIKDALETSMSGEPMSGQALALGMDTAIGEVGVTLFSGPGLELKDVVLRSRPFNANEKPSRVVIDRVVVHFGLWGLITGHPSYSFHGDAFGGTVKGTLGFDPKLMKIDVRVVKLALADLLPLAGSAVQLPTVGTLSGSAQLELPRGLLADAKGSIEVSISDGVVGDGKAKLVIPSDPMLSQGLTFPRIRIGQVDGKITLLGGKAQLTDWRLHSADADAAVEGTVELRDPWVLSQLRGYLRFKVSDALVKRESTIELLTNALAGTARRSDGWFGFQLAGSLGAPALVPSTTGPGLEPHVPADRQRAAIAAPPPPVAIVEAHPAEAAPPPIVAPEPAAAAPAAAPIVPPPAALVPPPGAAGSPAVPGPPMVNSIQPGRHHEPVDHEERDGPGPSPVAPLVAPEPL